jgi:hypothetical protein
VSKAELERCDPAEPRELAALQTNVRLLRQELDEAVAGEALTVAQALREAVRTSPLAGPARSLRRRVRPG